MLIGVPKEVKTHEFRMGLTATSVEELVRSGHTVLVQTGVGDGIGPARVAVGLGARVTVLDRSMRRLQELDERFGSKLSTVYATSLAVEKHVAEADLVIGAVLLPGASSPKLVRVDVVQSMRQGAVIVDVAIDQGGCFESSHPTTHTDPTYVVDGVVHYCVTNMPSAVARTASHALNNVTLPHVLALANRGDRRALQDNSHLLAGLNVHEGCITHPAVAEGLSMRYVPPERALGKVTGRGQD